MIASNMAQMMKQELQLILQHVGSCAFQLSLLYKNFSDFGLPTIFLLIIAPNAI